MEYNNIRYFIETCNHTSISKAARHMHISPQALSKTIAKLEQDFGAKLFDKSVSGIKLTTEGRFLYTSFYTHTKEYEKIIENLKKYYQKMDDYITIYIPPLVFNAIDINKFFQFDNLHYKIKKIELSVLDCISKIKSDNTALAICPYPDSLFSELDLESEYIKNYPINVYLHKGNLLTSKNTLTPLDIKNQKIIMLDKISENEAYLRHLENKYHLSYDIEHTSSSSSEILNYINNNKGIFIFFDLPISNILYPNVEKIPLNDENESFSLRFIFRNKEYLPKKYVKFMDFIMN